jgi:hypothetical protein
MNFFQTAFDINVTVKALIIGDLVAVRLFYVYNSQNGRSIVLWYAIALRGYRYRIVHRQMYRTTAGTMILTTDKHKCESTLVHLLKVAIMIKLNTGLFRRGTELGVGCNECIYVGHHFEFYKGLLFCKGIYSHSFVGGVLRRHRV